MFSAADEPLCLPSARVACAVRGCIEGRGSGPAGPAKSLGPNQIDLVKLVVDYLTEHGVMSAALLYETPFIDFHHAGPNGLFSSAKVDELMAVLEHVRTMATAA